MCTHVLIYAEVCTYVCACVCMIFDKTHTHERAVSVHQTSGARPPKKVSLAFLPACRWGRKSCTPHIWSTCTGGRNPSTPCSWPCGRGHGSGKDTDADARKKNGIAPGEWVPQQFFAAEIAGALALQVCSSTRTANTGYVVATANNNAVQAIGTTSIYPAGFSRVQRKQRAVVRSPRRAKSFFWNKGPTPHAERHKTHVAIL